MSAINVTDSKRIPWLDVVPVLIIVLVPLIYWTYSCVRMYRIPYQAYDPEYAYFLSSLAPFKGGDYTYIDHPGTPLEIIGTILLGVTYPFVPRNPENFIQYNLDSPEIFLSIVHFFLLVSSVACALFFYYSAVPKRNWWSVSSAASLAMMFYVLHPASFFTLTYWSHNSFNFPFGTALLLVLWRVIQCKGEIHPKTVLLLGLGTGVLTAVVIYSFTWIIGAAVTIGARDWIRHMPWRKTLLVLVEFLVSCVIGFILAILPILGRTQQFFNWIMALTFHQGIYGTGAAGITSPSFLLVNLIYILQSAPILFLSIGVILLIFLYAIFRWRPRFSTKPELWALALGMTIQILISFLIILKHPGPYYSLSIASAVPVLLLVFGKLIEHNPAFKAVFDRILSSVVLAGLVITLVVSMEIQSNRIANILRAQAEVTNRVNELKAATGRKSKQVVVVWAYGIANSCNALVRVNDNYIHVFNVELKKMCPGQYIVNEIYMTQPIALAPDGRTINLNITKWDFIIIRKITAENLVGLLDPKPIGEDIIGGETAPPGYKADEVVTIFHSEP